MMTGLDPATFWLSNVICDYSVYIISIFLTILLLVLMDEMDYFTTNGCTGETTFTPLLKKKKTTRSTVIAPGTYFQEPSCSSSLCTASAPSPWPTHSAT